MLFSEPVIKPQSLLNIVVDEKKKDTDQLEVRNKKNLCYINKNVSASYITSGIEPSQEGGKDHSGTKIHSHIACAMAGCNRLRGTRKLYTQLIFLLPDKREEELDFFFEVLRANRCCCDFIFPKG